MTVSDQIIQVLDALCAKFNIVVDWTSSNVIPYIEILCQKLVTWEIWSSVAWMAVMILACAIWFIIARVYRKPIKESYSEAEILGTVAKGVTVFLPLITFIVIGIEIFDIIKCVTFPELTIVEYIQKLTQPAA